MMQRKPTHTALRRELEGVRHINEVIEGVINTLERGKGKYMGVCDFLCPVLALLRSWLTDSVRSQTVGKTVGNASTLLNTWTRILSQTEHTSALDTQP